MSNGEEELTERSIVLAYQRLFKSKDGKIVLDHLAQVFGTNGQAFIPVHKQGTKVDAIYGFDPIRAALKDGNRGVILHIEAMRDAAVMDDDDGKEVKKVTKVRK